MPQPTAALEGARPSDEDAQPDSVSAFGGDEHLRAAGYRLISLADTAAQQIDWFWQGYIPFGMLTGLYADPNVGKSTISLDLAARATTGGPMPDGSPGMGPANIIILSAEDPLAEVIRPRLDAAGADIRRVSTVTFWDDAAATERPLIIPDDLDRLESAIRERDAKLVVIDVLVAYLSGEVNSYRDQDVRRALGPLQAVAERTGAAIIVIGHPTKNSQQAPIYRVGGSIGIIGTYRACFVAAPAPDGSDLCVLAPLKMNLSKMPEAMSYRIDDAGGAGVVRWLGYSSHTSKTLLATSRPAGHGEALQDAMDFLVDRLREGPIRATKVEEMARAEEISKATLRRAKKELGVEAEKVGQPGELGYWVWTLPPEGAHLVSEDAHPADARAFEPDDQKLVHEPGRQCHTGRGHTPLPADTPGLWS